MATPVEYVLSLKDGNFTKGVDSASGSVDNLERKLASVGSMIGVTFGTAAIALFGKSMVDAGTKVENAKTGLTTLLQSAKEAQSVIDNTMIDATKTPFAFEGLLSANKALIGAGVESKKAREDVLNLANAISATGGGDSELERMVINLQQISNTGKATALDIKQFAFAGVNIYKVLSAAGIKTGKDTEVTYNQITSALKRAHEAGGIYYNGLENMAGNTSVQISNLGDAIFQLKVKMFNDLKPAITSIVSGLSDFIGWMRKAWDWVAKNNVAIKQWVSSLAAGLVVFKAVTFALEAWPALLMAIEGGLYAVLRGNIALSASFAAAINPVTLLAAGVGALVLAYQKLEEIQEKKTKYLGDTSADEADFVQQGMGKYKGQKNAMMLAVADEQADIKRSRDIWEKSLKDNDPSSDKFRLFQSSDSYNEYKEATKQLEILGARQQGLDKVRSEGLIKPKTLAKPSGSGISKVDSTKSKATGSKSVTINVTIKELVHDLNYNVTNVKEGMGKIKDGVVAALTGAVNDFQIVAGQ